MYCSKCGKELPLNASVCPDCGAAQAENDIKEVSAKNAASGDFVISMGEWFVTILLTWIPIVGLVMMFVWGFGGGTNSTKKNWARANLIWMVVGIVLSILFGATIIAAFINALN